MNSKLFTAVSTLAMMLAVTAYAETGASVSAQSDTTLTTPGKAVDGRTAGDASADTSTGSQFKAGLDNLATDTVNTFKGVGNAAASAIEDIQAQVMDEGAKTTNITMNTNMTAAGMLGKPIVNNKDEKVGNVKDIILDEQGNARMIVVSDGGFMGMGDKLAAFDYSIVAKQNADGDVIMPLSEDVISKVAEFSYDAKDASDKVQVVPSKGYSVAALLKGKLVNPKNEAVANIENISFRNGQAAQVIVAYDQTLGIGGKKAAFDFDNLTLVKTGDNAADFKMSGSQTAKFEAFKNNMKVN